jgi:hypothetical protein
MLQDVRQVALLIAIDSCGGWPSRQTPYSVRVGPTGKGRRGQERGEYDANEQWAHGLNPRIIYVHLRLLDC